MRRDEACFQGQFAIIYCLSKVGVSQIFKVRGRRSWDRQYVRVIGIAALIQASCAGSPASYCSTKIGPPASVDL